MEGASASPGGKGNGTIHYVRAKGKGIGRHGQVWAGGWGDGGGGEEDCRSSVRRLEEGLVGDELLGDDAGAGEHGEAAVVELLRLHRHQARLVLGLEAERVEAEVARQVVGAERAHLDLSRMRATVRVRAGLGANFGLIGL